MSLTTSGNWIGNFVVAMATPILLGSSLGTPGTFYIIGGLLFLAFLFVLFTLPETKVTANTAMVSKLYSSVGIVLYLVVMLWCVHSLFSLQGESLERVEQLFKKPWLQRVRIFYYLRSCLNVVHRCNMVIIAFLHVALVVPGGV